MPAGAAACRDLGRLLKGNARAGRYATVAACAASARAEGLSVRDAVTALALPTELCWHELEALPINAATLVANLRSADPANAREHTARARVLHALTIIAIDAAKTAGGRRVDTERTAHAYAAHPASRAALRRVSVLQASTRAGDVGQRIATGLTGDASD